MNKLIPCSILKFCHGNFMLEDQVKIHYKIIKMCEGKNSKLFSSIVSSINLNIIRLSFILFFFPLKCASY